MDTFFLRYASHKGLALGQFAVQGQDTFLYITGDRAIREHRIEVAEINDAGSVNNIAVLNNSPHFVFFMDGDILAGAKQNRVVNTSLLLAPQSKTIMPVSCVEAGRWRHVSKGFTPTDYAAPSALRMDKARQVRENLRRGMKAMADQGEVWRNVSQYHERSAVYSATNSLSDVFTVKKNEFDEFITSFTPEPTAVGMSVFVGERLLAIDVFHRTEVFAEYFPKLLRGVALEVYNLPEKKRAVSEAEARFRTLDFFDRFEALPWGEFPAAAMGKERRFETEDQTGFALEYDSQLIHATALGMHERRQKTTGDGRPRFSQ